MICLKELANTDGIDVFEMLKGIDSVENSFTNPTYDMSFSEFRVWLAQQEQWSKGKMLPEGYVAQCIYWLYDDDIPVGMGKIRHSLTDASRECGGNIGYAISAAYRKKGYGEKLLELLLSEARKIGIREILLTVDKANVPSKRICEENGGIIIKETPERWYFSF